MKRTTLALSGVLLVGLLATTIPSTARFHSAAGDPLLLTAFFVQDEEESTQCRKFREWREDNTLPDGPWPTHLVVSGCKDLSRSDWFDVADGFGNYDSVCQEAGTYRRWFQSAWDGDGWRIQFTLAQDSVNMIIQDGFHMEDSTNHHWGIGVRDDYDALVVIHEVRTYLNNNRAA